MEKAEVEGKGSANSQKTIKGENPPLYPPLSEQMQESLKIINKETLQLSRFLFQEEKLIKELCVLLMQVLKQLNVSFNLPANIFPQTWKTQRIILDPEAHLIFMSTKNEVKSKALENFPPQIILNVATFLIPELSKALTSYRRKISSRIGLFESINQELRNLSDIFANRSEKLGENINLVDDGVKKAPLAKNKGLGEENKRHKESV